MLVLPCMLKKPLRACGATFRPFYKNTVVQQCLLIKCFLEM